MNLLRKHYHFFLPLLVYLLAGVWLMLRYTDLELFLAINGFHATGLDYFESYYTWVGDGLFAIALALLLSLRRVRYGLVILTSYAISGILAQVLKRWVFSAHVRPWKMWGESEEVHVVKGVELYSNNSFPSGHTTTAFCLFTLLALFHSDRRWGFIFFILALLVGHSRIYLAEHHFADVYAGAVLGSLTSLGIYYYFYSPKRFFNRRATWLDRPLHKLRK